jgi:hypothetical protein
MRTRIIFLKGREYVLQSLHVAHSHNCGKAAAKITPGSPSRTMFLQTRRLRLQRMLLALYVTAKKKIPLLTGLLTQSRLKYDVVGQQQYLS